MPREFNWSVRRSQPAWNGPVAVVFKSNRTGHTFLSAGAPDRLQKGQPVDHQATPVGTHKRSPLESLQVAL